MTNEIKPMFDKLIGAQLIELNERGFKIQMANGDIRTYKFEEDSGGCCGYNDFSVLLFDDEDTKENPVITNIAYEKAEPSYDFLYSGGQRLQITFFGAHKKLATIDSYSSSGSGWCYGACVTVDCVETGEHAVITNW